MSATNTTPFLQLPQFAATDKPTWLGDFNGAMSKIDTGVASNNNKITEQTAQIAAVQKMAENASVEAISVTISFFNCFTVPKSKLFETSIKSITVSSRSSSNTFTKGLL